MTCVGFLILFGLSCLFLCEGKVSPPSDGTNLVFLRGSTKRIVWSYDDDIEAVSRRFWNFESSDGKLDERLGFLDGDGGGGVKMLTSLLDVEIETPATLVLKNINETYDGTYKFSLQPSKGGAESEVIVSIVVTPMVKVECSNPATVNTSDSFTCLCKGQGGKPPANVTWYKGNEKKSGPGNKEPLLRLLNVNKNDNGTYRCEAKSHELAKNDTEIELIVNYPPQNVEVMLTRSGKSATIRCTADALPPANFKIFLNQTKKVKSDQMHTITVVEKNDVGYYTCFAWNFLGSKTSDREYLPLKGQTATTSITSPTTSTMSSGKGPGAGDDVGDDGALGVGAIIGIVIGVLVLLVIVVVVVWRYKLKEKDGYSGNVDPVEMEDNAYDTVKNEPSGSKSNPQASTLPVYAAVDKNNREGKPLYATLDTVAMNSDGSKRRSEESKPEPTQYASIDFERSGEVPKADLV